MTIKDLKEAWPGRSEVHIKAHAIQINDDLSGNCGLDLSGGANCFNIDGTRIKRVKRKDKNDEFNADFTVDNQLGLNSNHYVFLTIFENDNFPLAPEKTSFFNFNGVQRSFKWRSWND
jgi:hypothetical protein